MKKIVDVLAIVIFYTNCSKNNSTDTNTTCDPNVSYSKDVAPIVAKSCNMAGCHDGNTTTSLADYTIMHDGVLQIKTSIISGRMPKTCSLTVAEKTVISCWVDDGAKNN